MTTTTPPTPPIFPSHEAALAYGIFCAFADGTTARIHLEDAVKPTTLTGATVMKGFTTLVEGGFLNVGKEIGTPGFILARLPEDGFTDTPKVGVSDIFGESQCVLATVKPGETF